MAKICLSLTAKTLAQDLEILKKYRNYIDLVELRVDCLDPDERLQIRGFPEMAGIPVILAIRRSSDGGQFVGMEGARITLLAKGLAYAEADRRLNFAYVDLEEDLDVPGLEEAARAFGTRIIRSWHSIDGIREDLVCKILKLRRIGDEIVKIAVTLRSLEEMVYIHKISKETRDVEKVFCITGEYELSAGVLSEFFGSQMFYTSHEAGHIDPKELTELYRFNEINKKTKIFAAAAYPFKNYQSVLFFNTVFRMEKTNAVFVPIPADSAKSLMNLAGEIGIAGISVDPPYKEEILQYLTHKSKEVASIGVCNVVVSGSQGWFGYNTDAPAFTDSLLGFMGKKDLWGKKLIIVGIGSIASAVAAEVYRLKGKALILSHTAAQARLLAEQYRFDWAAPEGYGMDLIRKYSGIIIQTKSLELENNDEDDPLEFYKFSGRELVMGFVSKNVRNNSLKRAEAAYCRILDGYEMLHRQVRYKYNHFMNREFPPSLISRVGF